MIDDPPGRRQIDSYSLVQRAVTHRLGGWDLNTLRSWLVRAAAEASIGDFKSAEHREVSADDGK